MRKLLLLLPALALASCSGGHDLMSNKPFRIRCEAPASDREGTLATTLLVSPDMPQATLLSDDQIEDMVQAFKRKGLI